MKEQKATNVHIFLFVEKNKKIEICVHDHDKYTHTLHGFSALIHNEYESVQKITSKVAESVKYKRLCTVYSHVNLLVVKKRQT